MSETSPVPEIPKTHPIGTHWKPESARWIQKGETYNKELEFHHGSPDGKVIGVTDGFMQVQCPLPGCSYIANIPLSALSV